MSTVLPAAGASREDYVIYAIGLFCFQVNGLDRDCLSHTHTLTQGTAPESKRLSLIAVVEDPSHATYKATKTRKSDAV